MSQPSNLKFAKIIYWMNIQVRHSTSAATRPIRTNHFLALTDEILNLYGVSGFHYHINDKKTYNTFFDMYDDLHNLLCELQMWLQIEGLKIHCGYFNIESLLDELMKVLNYMI